MTELTNINMELDPYLKQMLNAYGNIPERDPKSARRTQEKFLTEINNTLLEPTMPRSTTRRSVQSAWILSIAHLKEVFIPVFGSRTALRGFVTLMILGVFFFGGAGITAYAAGSSLPGDALYPVKTTVEQVRISLLNDSAAQASLHLQFAGRRVSELQSLIDKGRYAEIAQTAIEFEIHIQHALSGIETLSQINPARAFALYEELIVILRSYREVLAYGLANAPEDSRSVFQNVINPSPSSAGQQKDDDDDDGKLPAVSPTGLPNGTAVDFSTSTPIILPTSTPIRLPTSTPESMPFVPPASSVIEGEDATCEGALGSVTVNNLIVPPGASCTLDGTKVNGNIKIENGASLMARSVTVIGNIQAEGANYVEVLAGSTVGGSIQVKQGGGVRVEGVSVNGDIQIESNNGAFSILGNLVGGNIQIFQNAGDTTVANNVANGNLQCKENVPMPVGGNNTVQGNKEDQCAGL